MTSMIILTACGRGGRALKFAFTALRPLTILAAAALASGCVSLGANLEARDLSTRPATIHGIGNLGERGAQARMLVVHGMGGDRCPGYSISNYRFSDNKEETPGMLSQMSKALGVCLLNDPRDADTIHCVEEDVSSYPTLKLTKFDFAKADPDAPCSGQTVMRVYELYYTGAGEPAEQTINTYNHNTLGNSVYVNRIIKEELMVSGFGDAVMYLGEWGNTIRAAVRETLCQMATDSWAMQGDDSGPCPSEINPNAFVDSEVYILSHSLGSNIVLDTLDETLADPNQYDVEAVVVEELIGNIKSAYLMANQDAMLGMVTVTPGMARSSAAKIAGFSQFLAAEAQVVAFSGRNDALSYALAADACPAHDTQCINAALNVARWGIPFFFANPVKAHTGYFSDKTAINCVARGCE